MVPSGAMAPTLAPAVSLNHIRPTPSTIASGWELGVGVGNSVICPDGVIRPIL